MVRTFKGPIAEEEWNFIELLEGASEYEVSFCRLYEFGREVFDLNWFKENRRRTGPWQSEMMLANPQLFAVLRNFRPSIQEVAPKERYGSKPPNSPRQAQTCRRFFFYSLWHPIVRRALGDCFRCGINSNMMAG